VDGQGAHKIKILCKEEDVKGRRKMITNKERKEIRSLQDELVKQCEELGMRTSDEVFYRITLGELKFNIFPEYREEIESALAYYKITLTKGDEPKRKQ